MKPTVRNSCSRCDSTEVELHQNGIFTCKSCGKAERVYLMHLRFEFPKAGEGSESAGEPEVVNCRHLPREMEGFLSESLAPNMALAISRLIRSYGVKVSPQETDAIIARSISVWLNVVWQLLIPYLPEALREEFKKAEDAVTRANRMMAEERAKSGGGKEGSDEPGAQAAGNEPAGGLESARNEIPRDDSAGSAVSDGDSTGGDLERSEPAPGGDKAQGGGESSAP